jgi:KUP system potassium uptake protein
MRSTRDSPAAFRGTGGVHVVDPKTMPPILVHYVRRSRALHETVILATVQFGNSPTLPEDERLTAIQEPGTGFWRVIIHYGFMEAAPVVEMLVKAAAEYKIPYDAQEVVYFLGRESFIASGRGRMGVGGREYIFFPCAQHGGGGRILRAASPAGDRDRPQIDL